MIYPGQGTANFVDAGNDTLRNTIYFGEGDTKVIVHMLFNNSDGQYYPNSDTFFDFWLSNLEYTILNFHGGPRDGTQEYLPGPIGGLRDKVWGPIEFSAADTGEYDLSLAANPYALETLFSQANAEQAPPNMDPYLLWATVTVDAATALTEFRGQLELSFDPRYSPEFAPIPIDNTLIDMFGDDFVNATAANGEEYAEVVFGQIMFDQLVYYGILESDASDEQYSAWDELIDSQALTPMDPKIQDSWSILTPDSFESHLLLTPFIEFTGLKTPYDLWSDFSLGLGLDFGQQ